MRVRSVIIGLIAVAALGARDKKIPVRSTENDLVEVTATALNEREEVKQALGSDLGGHYILVQVTVAPKEGQKIQINHDDFVLKTDNDGSRTTPFVPSQIAGKGALVVSTGGTGGGTYAGPSEPGWGPLGPIMSPGGMMGGGGGAEAGETQTRIHSGSKDTADPILEVLKQKILPDGETDKPVSGLLYFPMEKQKLKDLELFYTTPEGKLTLRFK